jgi:hypothetical protein
VVISSGRRISLMTPSCRSESGMALSPNTDGAYLILKLYEVEKMLVLIFFDNATHMDAGVLVIARFLLPVALLLICKNVISQDKDLQRYGKDTQDLRITLKALRKSR